MKMTRLLSEEQLVVQWLSQYGPLPIDFVRTCLLNTSEAADEARSVDRGGGRGG